MSRWSVRRTGSPAGGYGKGWIAFNRATGVGAWFPTWRRAQSFADHQAFLEAVAAR